MPPRFFVLTRARSYDGKLQAQSVKTQSTQRLWLGALSQYSSLLFDNTQNPVNPTNNG